MSAIEQLLAKLVAISSVSAESNLPLLDFVRSILTPHGWAFTEQRYQGASGVEQANLIAWPPGSTARPDVELAFVCHTDTVPYDREWKTALTLKEHNGGLHGCGACDVKGYLACLLTVAQEAPRSTEKPWCLVLTAEEEVGCVGAQRLAAAALVRPRYAVIGEPTSLRPAIAGKGYCLAEITVQGREAHSAFPGNGRSAVLDMAAILVELESLATLLEGERDSRFFPPWTTLNIGVIEGGTAKNIVPAQCAALLEWRPIPGQQPDRVLDEVRRIIDATAVRRPGLTAELRPVRAQAGFALREQSALFKVMCELAQALPTTAAFGTEASWFECLGAEAVVLGPGSMQTAHSPGEFVPVAELNRCCDLIRGTLATFCR